ncbi:MAG: RsmE family RNA methyltransferase [Planctomycetota bacterium]|jgi:16S rRNA (uracil1498-N3)-methyltransferase
MARRYLLQDLSEDQGRRAPSELAHHLCSVMRYRVGDRIRLFDGKGMEAAAVIRVCKRDRVELDIGPASSHHREPDLELALAFPVPRGSRSDWLLEHGCELGVRHFYPISSARSRGPASEGRRDRWLRILAAAAGQCDRSRMPELHEPSPLSEFLQGEQLPEERYLAGQSEQELGAAISGAALLLVGPEGGFRREELEAILEAGFSPRSLGPLTLRTETAALVGAARLLQGPATHGTG